MKNKNQTDFFNELFQNSPGTNALQTERIDKPDDKFLSDILRISNAHEQSEMSNKSKGPGVLFQLEAEQKKKG